MSDYNSTATSTIYVNGKPAEQELQKLKQRASDLRDAIASAAKAGEKADLKKLRNELKQANREIKQVEGAIHSCEVVMKRLDKATPKELNMALKQLKKELNDMERGSRAWDEQVKKIKRVKSEISKCNNELKEHESFLTRVKNTCNGWGMAVAAAAASMTGLTMTIRQAVQAYADMDQEMAGVRKYTGMTDEQVKALNEDLKKIDTRTPREELNKLAQDAGRLGKQSQEDVLGFVRAADQINVALDDLGEGATLTLSKIAGAFGEEERYGTEQALLKTGSVINELSQNCRASAPYLADFTQRLTGAGTTAHMTIPQLMAFGAVLDSNGAQLESSATALGQVIIKLYRDPAKYAEAAGMDVQKFTELLKTDANEAVLTFLQTLHDAGDLDTLAPMLADMGEKGSRSVQTLTMLAGKIDEVRAQQKAANIAFEEGVSVTKEFNVQNNTVQAQLDKAKNNFHEMAVELGEKLLPVARYAVSGTSAMMHALSGAINFVIKYKASLITLTATIVAMTIAVNAQTIAINALIAKEAIVNGLTKAWTAITGVAKVATLAFAVATNTLTGNMTRAAAASRALKMALVSTGWGAIIAVVGTLAAAFVGLASQTEKTTSTVTGSIDVMKKKQAEWADAVASSVNAQLSQYYMLQRKWKECNGDVKLQGKFLKDYGSEIRSVTGRVLGLVDAEDIFVKNTQAVVNAIIARTEAEVGKKLYAEALEKRLRNDRNGTTQNGRYYVTVHRQLDHGRNSATGEEMQAYERATGKRSITGGGGQSGQGYVLTPEAQSWIENRRKNQASSIRQQDYDEERYWLDYTMNAEKRADAAEKRAGIRPGGSDSRPSGAYSGGNGSPSGGSNGSHHSGGSSHSGHSGGSGHGGHNSTAAEDKFAAEKASRKDSQDNARLSWALGLMSDNEYKRKLLEIEQEFNEAIMNHPGATEAEKLEAEANYWEKNKEWLKSFNDESLEDFEKNYRVSVSKVMQDYVDGTLTLEEYNRRVEDMELEHLRQTVEKHKEGTKERLDAEEAYQKKLFEMEQKRQDEAEETYKKYYEQAQKMKELKEEYFGLSDEEKAVAYSNAVATLDQIYQSELKKLGDNLKAKLELQKKYEKAKKKIYEGIYEADLEDGKKSTKNWQEWTETILDKMFGKGTWEKYGGFIESSYNTLMSTYQNATKLIEAGEQAKLAAMTKKYDAEIKAAEGNQYRINQIEKRKAAEEKRIKDAANKRAMAMELAQAMSGTALAAINAYASASKVAFWLGPIAAAAAVAAGMIQVAAIKKQHDAQSEGYSEGGFTKPGAKNEPAGVVHAGEWVASQRLLASPVARPVINMLDHAQRTNTIGRLGGAMGAAAPVVVTESEALRSVIKQLTDRLSEPFVTINTVTGPHGIEQAQNDYKKLMNNTLPKNKRK